MTSNGQGRAVNAIEVEHIVKKFGEFTAVNDVSFTVARREIFGLAGTERGGEDHADTHHDDAYAADFGNGSD